MDTPLVSVLLCTHNARHLLPLAIDSYRQQDYERRELVVVDDGTDRIFDMVEDIAGLNYIALPYDAKRSLSAKRNLGCRAAKGEIIVHFDSDDWSGPARVRDQVWRLLSNPWALITGYKTAYWWNYPKQRASRYSGSVWGATMAYRRSYALAHPWDESVCSAEDGPFQDVAREKCAVDQTDAGANMVVTMSASQRAAEGACAQWPLVGIGELPRGFDRYLSIT
jgi:glycosyltransferase involved in cell wall biosynthesis